MATGVLTRQLTGIHVAKDDLSHQQPENLTCLYASLLKKPAVNPSFVLSV